MSQANALKRLDAIESVQRQAFMDRYLAYVAHVDGLTPDEVAGLRERVMKSGANPEPATPDEIATAHQLWDEMVVWEVATGRSGEAA